MGDQTFFGMSLTWLVVPAQAGTQAVLQRAPWALSVAWWW